MSGKGSRATARVLTGALLSGLCVVQGAAKGPPQASGFQPVYRAGTRDANGQFMGGTELFTLVSHGGKLWASTGYYWDLPGKDPSPGAQVLVLDHPGGAWRVDHPFEPKQWRASLDSVTFTTDGQGGKLAQPVSLLLAFATDPDGKIVAHSRDDETGVWTAAPVATNSQIVSVRGVAVHRDAVTGVDRVIAATFPNGVFSGVYAADAPGRIRWEKDPELAGYGRPMGFVECGGALYLAAKPHLYRRVDGASPRWEKVYSVQDSIPKTSVGLRGLAAIPDPEGRGQVILAALDGNPAMILRIDPAHGYAATVELDVVDFLRQQWKRRPTFVIPAYNGMTVVTDPRTGKTVHLLGLAVNFAAPRDDYPKEGWERGGWYLIRSANGRYELRQILVPGQDPQPKLVATRQIEPSPFGEPTLYFAGYDPNTNLSHNTAWIVSAPLAAALAPQRQVAEEPAATAIMAIQGAGPISPWNGRAVKTAGVVTLVDPRRAGFWIQDPTGDHDAKTSDGLFVSALGLPPDAVFPQVKDTVRVVGEVEEEGQKGTELTRTRLRDVSRIEVVAKDRPLPEPVVLQTLAASATAEEIAAWEAVEGMRVQVAGATGVADFVSGGYKVQPEGSPAEGRAGGSPRR